MTKHNNDVSQASSAGNLFDALPVLAQDQVQERVQDEEIFETLLTHANVRIERIISTGQVSPAGFWYDQTQSEWVMVVQGSASIRFEDEPEPRDLKSGDYIYIAPRRRHRVEMTQADPPTIWLAVHIDNPT